MSARKRYIRTNFVWAHSRQTEPDVTEMLLMNIYRLDCQKCPGPGAWWYSPAKNRWAGWTMHQGWDFFDCPGGISAILLRVFCAAFTTFMLMSITSSFQPPYSTFTYPRVLPCCILDPYIFTYLFVVLISSLLLVSRFGGIPSQYQSYGYNVIHSSKLYR